MSWQAAIVLCVLQLIAIIFVIDNWLNRTERFMLQNGCVKIGEPVRTLIATTYLYQCNKKRIRA